MPQDDSPFDSLFKTGTVINASPQTRCCDILKTEGGALYDVPIMNSAGGIFSNDSCWNTNLKGAVVCYAYISGRPYIFGTMPTPVYHKNKTTLSPTQTETGADNTATYGAATKPSFSAGRDGGYMPGDKVLTADGGAELALLNEGLAVLKASPLAQIILGGMMDFIKIVCREFRLMSDFGEMILHHGSGGSTGISITGGAKYSEEAQEGTGTPTVHMHLGQVPEAPNSRFGVRVNSTDGSQFGGIVMGLDGELREATSQNRLVSVGKDCETRINGNDYHKIDQGRTIEVGKDDSLSVMGGRSILTASDESHSVGGNLDIQVQNTLRVGAANIEITSYSGGGGPCTMKCASFDIRKA